MGQDHDDLIERGTAKRRAALVIRIVKGGTSVAEAAWQHGLRVVEVEGWHDQFLRAAEKGLQWHPKNEEALKEEQIKKLPQKIRELMVENDVRRETLPSSAGAVRRVRAAVSDISERKACRLLRVPRSGFFLWAASRDHRSCAPL